MHSLHAQMNTQKQTHTESKFPRKHYEDKMALVLAT